jgi:hypothetical protein
MRSLGEVAAGESAIRKFLQRSNRPSASEIRRIEDMIEEKKVWPLTA